MKAITNPSYIKYLLFAATLLLGSTLSAQEAETPS